MNVRSSNCTLLKKLSKDSHQSDILNNQNYFSCLNGLDVMTAQISDHHPIIHNNTLFWNVMMRGRARITNNTITSYNNAFGIIENEKQYAARLVKIAIIIAEIINNNPSINTIGLCEGPIEADHVKILLNTLKQFQCMQRFIRHNTLTTSTDFFYKPNNPNTANWGLLMLADNSFQVTEVKCELIETLNLSKKLANRFQIWELRNYSSKIYFSLGHFPFSGDELVTKTTHLSVEGNQYCDLVNKVLLKYSNDLFVLCADFNLNPYLISNWKDRMVDRIPANNSRLLISQEKEIQITPVTVDGVLLSVKEKQRKYHLFLIPDLFNLLLREYSLFKTVVQKYITTQASINHDILPAKAGIQTGLVWMPAFAGKTRK